MTWKSTGSKQMSKFEKTLRAERVLINQELFQEAKPVFPRWASCIVLLNKSWLKIASFHPSSHSIVKSTALLYRDVSLTKTSNHFFLSIIHVICLSWWTHLKNKFPRSTLEPLCYSPLESPHHIQGARRRRPSADLEIRSATCHLAIRKKIGCLKEEKV